MSDKWKQLVALIVNEEEQKASDLFHEIVIENSREIYENLISQEDIEETSEEQVDEVSHDEVKDFEKDIKADEEGISNEDDMEDAGDDLEAEMILIMKSLGISGDFTNYYRTDSEEYRALTQSTFINLWKKGEVYLANRPNNYDWVSGTTIADAEIIYDDLQTKLVYMKFKIKDTDKEIIIASTRPELLCACRTIIVNPEDERYTEFIGKKIIVHSFFVY